MYKLSIDSFDLMITNGDDMEIDKIITKMKNDIKNKQYDMVPTFKNRNSKRKYGLTQIDIEDYRFI